MFNRMARLRGRAIAEEPRGFRHLNVGSASVAVDAQRDRPHQERHVAPEGVYRSRRCHCPITVAHRGRPRVHPAHGYKQKLGEATHGVCVGTLWFEDPRRSSETRIRLGVSGRTAVCESAWGLHADRRANLLIVKESEGSKFHAGSQPVADRSMACGYRRSDTGRRHSRSAGTQRLQNQSERRIHAKTPSEVDGRRPFRVTMQTLRRDDPAGGSFAPVRLAAFRWNRWQTSAVYAFSRLNSATNSFRPRFS